MKMNINYEKMLAEAKIKCINRYFSAERETQDPNVIWIWENLLVLVIKTNQSDDMSDEKIISNLRYLGWRLRYDRFIEKGYTSAESDVDYLTFMLDDVIQATLNQGDEKSDYYLRYDLCDVQGRMVLKIEIVRYFEAGSPVRFECLQQNKSLNDSIK